MNCNICGVAILPEQKFCRSCGASLSTATQPLEPTRAVNEHKSQVILHDEQQRSNRLVLWAMITMFVGVAIGVIGAKLLHKEIVTVTGVLIALIGMFLTAFPYLSPAPRKRSESSLPSPPKSLSHSQTSESLPEANEAAFIPSVTERTTDLLKDLAPTKLGPKETE